jgi:SAM-dependent methyltransferase
VLDVGCGNGEQAQNLMNVRADVRVIGLEVKIRPTEPVEMVHYGGGVFPFADRSLGGVLIIDTLHHIQEPREVLIECLRVTEGPVVIKDHFYENQFEHLLLRLLDLAGNAAHGVSSIYNYFRRVTWNQLLEEIGAEETYRLDEVPDEYPLLLQPLLGRRIQFVAVIRNQERSNDNDSGRVDPSKGGFEL